MKSLSRLGFALFMVVSLGKSSDVPTAHATHAGYARVMQQAAALYGHERPAAVVQQLTTLPGVKSAALGTDLKSIDIIFDDGIEAMVLPSKPKPTSLPGGGFQVHFSGRRPSSAPASERRALLLAPFGSDLGVIPHMDQEAAVLHADGFAVTQFNDAAVTVDTMSTLSAYDLVYMVTHSGTNQYGDAVLATAQQADPDHVDPALSPLIQEGSVMITGVAGSSLEYYGVRARFMYDHLEGTFPHNSLVFLNGCSVLRGSLFWRVLQLKGAATMVSWDDLAATTSDAPAGAAFFSDMTGPRTVAQTIDDMQRSGAGVSSWAGKAAHLGYLGDGTLTLDGRSSATSTPLPTATPSPTATVTSSPTPTPLPATSTPVPTLTLTPAPALDVTLKKSVRPGRMQIIVVRTLPRLVVRFVVLYPGGDKQTARRRSNTFGVARYAYVQPPQKKHAGRRITHVRVIVSGPTGPFEADRTYRIG